MSPRESRRDAILEAAAELVRDKGAAHLTLDAVSARAKLSKGGLLYHFRTKDALIKGMMSRIEEVMNRAQERELAKLPASPARLLKAYVLSMEAFRHKEVQPIAAALLAAGTHDPELLKQTRKPFEEKIAELTADGLSGAFIRVVISAVEGHLISELLGRSTYTRKQHKAFIGELLRLVDEEEVRSCK